MDRAARRREDTAAFRRAEPVLSCAGVHVPAQRVGDRHPADRRPAPGSARSEDRTLDRPSRPEPCAPRRSRWPWVAGQLALAAALVFVYFRVRGLTEGSPAIAHANATEVVALERWLGVDGELGLQERLLEFPFAVTLANWVYIWGHWPVIIASAVWLAWRHQDVFRRLRDAMMISGGAGMAIFAAFPLAPPRLADGPLVDTVAEQSVSYRVLQPPAFVNQYAAMPSLHAGWDLLIGIALVTAASGIVLRVIGCVLPVLMALAVMATANHYVLDVVAGLALVLVAHAIAVWLERRRHRDPRRRLVPDSR